MSTFEPGFDVDDFEIDTDTTLSPEVFESHDDSYMQIDDLVTELPDVNWAINATDCMQYAID